ncbi:hypothetical protein TWF694_002069 [Orbilia ellipsospora]|uniref:rRNA N-glycosylase n=1 Tax=Orbilia ellipsospora TaxID=2528407 RepID=A0AAV9X4F5_9PEZI
MFIKYFAACVGVTVSLVHALPTNEPSTSKGPAAKPFSFRFDVNDATTSAQYHEWIAGFRTAAQSTEKPGFLPVLKEKPDLFDVVLATKDQGEDFVLNLKIRKDNLYLIGHQHNEVWMETKGSKHILNSQPLLFAGDYVGTDGLHAYSKLDTDDVLNPRELTKCGRKALSQAIQYLASDARANIELKNVNAKREKLNKQNKTTKPSKQNKQQVYQPVTIDAIRARAYLTLTQMLPESIRLNKLSKFIETNWEKGLAPTHDLIELENKWSSRSANGPSDDIAIALATTGGTTASTSGTQKTLNGGKTKGKKNN